MSARLIDLTGRRFSYLTVLGRSGTRHGHVLWLCLCKCGRRTSVVSVSLRKAVTRSCGCLRRQTSATNAKNARNAIAQGTQRQRLKEAEAVPMAEDLKAALAGAMAYWSVER